MKYGRLTGRALAAVGASVLWISGGAGALAPQAQAQEYGTQDTTSNPIAPEVSEEERLRNQEPGEGDLVWDFRLTTELHTSDNRDFREPPPIGERPTDLELLLSDDRETFGYTSVAGGLKWAPLPDVTVGLAGSHSALWGGDQVGTTNAFGSFLFITQLFVEWQAFEQGDFELLFRAGRQPFSIGGAADQDYFLRDILDAAVVEARFGIGGAVRILAADLFVAGGRPDDINFAQYLSSDSQSELNFRGDTNTFRFGGVYENTHPALGGFQPRVFAFYADLGAFASGSDRVYQGALGNFADNDWNAMAGARLTYEYPVVLEAAPEVMPEPAGPSSPLTPEGLGGAEGAGGPPERNMGEEPDPDFRLHAHVEYARSFGIDRKDVQAGFYDVAANGNAFGALVNAELDLGVLELYPQLEFFYADGTRYTEAEGLPFNHGFVSFKGAQAGSGSLLANRYGGWHPSAYIGYNNLTNTPQDKTRIAGTMLIGGKMGLGLLELVRLDLGAWYFQDTSSTDFDQADVDDVTPPLGYSQADLRALERAGEPLGVELDATLTYFPNEALSFYAIGAVFLPAEFYEIEIALPAGSALGSNDPQTFWAILGGMTFAL